VLFQRCDGLEKQRSHVREIRLGRRRVQCHSQRRQVRFAVRVPDEKAVLLGSCKQEFSHLRRPAKLSAPKGDRRDRVRENETHGECVLQRNAESETFLCTIVRLVGKSLLPEGPGKHGSCRNSLIEKHPSHTSCAGCTAWVFENVLRMVADGTMLTRKS